MVIKQNVPHGMDDPGLRRKDIVMIKLHDIQKDYGTVPVLENISLEIIPGKIYGLIGPNGAGKTTFLKILAGILRRDPLKSRAAGKNTIGGAERM